MLKSLWFFQCLHSQQDVPTVTNSVPVTRVPLEVLSICTSRDRRAQLWHLTGDILTGQVSTCEDIEGVSCVFNLTSVLSPLLFPVSSLCSMDGFHGVYFIPIAQWFHPFLPDTLTHWVPVCLSRTTWRLSVLRLAGCAYGTDHRSGRLQ